MKLPTRCDPGAAGKETTATVSWWAKPSRQAHSAHTPRLPTVRGGRSAVAAASLADNSLPTTLLAEINGVGLTVVGHVLRETILNKKIAETLPCLIVSRHLVQVQRTLARRISKFVGKPT
ncbi:hypothetical protein [Rhodococcus marinonascens]|uniref:hypothetical protein n=1 Tax=Rhodococcus marinonascens TaxID=38311 RepID=UPI001114BBC1|nr:hypothetical protein [Rhodococcus marinonascens]